MSDAEDWRSTSERRGRKAPTAPRGRSRRGAEAESDGRIPAVVLQVRPQVAGACLPSDPAGPRTARMAGATLDQGTLRTRLMRCDGVTVLTVRGEIDLAGQPQFMDAVRRAVESAEGRLFVDLARVSYVDSSACH